MDRRTLRSTLFGYNPRICKALHDSNLQVLHGYFAGSVYSALWGGMLILKTQNPGGIYGSQVALWLWGPASFCSFHVQNEVGNARLTYLLACARALSYTRTLSLARSLTLNVSHSFTGTNGGQILVFLCHRTIAHIKRRPPQPENHL